MWLYRGEQRFEAPPQVTSQQQSHVGELVNVLTITGRLAADPARRTKSNGVVCEFRLAIDLDAAVV